jgi:hypothetical protein
MNKEAYIAGVVAAYVKYAAPVGMGSAGAGVIGDVGFTPGQPSDQDPARRKNTIDRAFAINADLPSASSSTPEAPNRSP